MNEAVSRTTSAYLTPTRRRLLEGVGVGGAALLAGCSSTPRQDTNGSQTSSGEIRFTLSSVFNPSQLQFNDFNPTNNGTTQHNVGQMLYDRFLFYIPKDNKFRTESFIINDWTFNGDSVDIELSGDHNWHNGDSVTTKDVATHWKLDRYQYLAVGDEHPYISGVSEDSERTVTLQLHKTFNERLLLIALFTGQTRRLTRKHSRYKKWLDQFEQTSGQKEMQSILSDLQQQSFSKPLGNGPFKFSRRTGRTFELDLFKKHPSANKINFTGVEWLAFQDGQQELLATQSGKIDGNINLSPQEKSVMRTWPAGLDTPRHDIPSYGGRALWFNNGKEPFNDQRVRQAVAYLLDRKTITGNLPNSHTVDKVITGSAESSEQRWYGDVTSNFLQYGTNKERAMSLLNAAGVDPTDLSITIKTPPYQDSYIPVAQTAASQLRQHDISAETLTEEPATYYSNIANNNFEIGVNEWGGEGLPHPFFSYWNLYTGSTPNELQVSETYDMPPVGKPDGATSKVKPVDLLKEVQNADSADKMTKPIQKLGWTVNYQLPLLPITEGAVSTWIFHPKKWSYDTNNQDLLETYHPIIAGPRLGFLKAQQ